MGSHSSLLSYSGRLFNHSSGKQESEISLLKNIFETANKMGVFLM